MTRSHLLSFRILRGHRLELCQTIDLSSQHVDGVDDEHDRTSGEEEEAHDRQDAHVAVWGGEGHVQDNQGDATILYCSLQRDGNDLK